MSEREDKVVGSKEKEDKIELAMKQWAPVSIITGMLAFTVCVVILTAVIGPLITERELSVEKAEMVKQTLTALIGVVSVFIGTKLKSD